ncbi:hypothetical protein [Collimonas silvisoli]|uniref:hypothetical protein n=1 Tax=Collimonas silvisoli TaxID=2825884 RepID=UPI001B8AF229|nr:hypothetical protein [Collimonas silvisoli]
MKMIPTQKFTKYGLNWSASIKMSPSRKLGTTKMGDTAYVLRKKIASHWKKLLSTIGMAVTVAFPIHLHAQTSTKVSSEPATHKILTVEDMKQHEEQFQREYQAFRYSDDMRSKILELLQLVEDVMAGNQAVAALEKKLTINVKGENRIYYDGDFLSKWGEFTLRYNSNPAFPNGIEPRSFYFQFGPYLDGISLEQIESTLGLDRKPESEARINVPNFNMETGKITESVSLYLKYLRCGDFSLGVTMGYDANDSYEVSHPTKLKTIEIYRVRLYDETRKIRDQMFFGDLPRTGDMCHLTGYYLPIFPNQEKFAWATERPLSRRV